MINQLPPPQSKCEFIQRVDCLCAIHELSQTSGIRTIGHNGTVEGHEWSKHLIEMGGYAADLWPDDTVSLGPAERDAERIGLWAEIKRGQYGAYLHVQGIRPGRNPFR